jgi:thiamine-phosphate pyrophosphorylase
MCRACRIPFIVNDRIDLALAVKAEGLHLGQDDLPVQVARHQSGQAGQSLIVGKSTHNLDQALRAQDEGADYIGFGPVYTTATKENNVPAVGLEALARVLRKVSIPVVAIGGIKPRHLQELGATGAQHIAVVTQLTGAPNVAESTRAMYEQWKRFKRPLSQAAGR